MTGQLDGQRVVVTGAASGIGRAVAAAVVAEGGFPVLLDRDDNGLNETAGGLGEFGGDRYVVDLTDESATADVLAEVLRCGPVDVLVNQAGVIRRTDLLRDPISAWELVQRTNVTSMVLTCRAVLPAMLARGHGVVVNCASGAAFASGRDLPAYSASKAAVLALTRSICVDHGPTVRANAVCPGLIDTPGAWSSATPDQQAGRHRAAQALPLRRLGTAAEVADAVVFLASPRSSFCSGMALVVDGGGLAQA